MTFAQSMEQAPFNIGEPVVDRDSESDDPNTAIIVNCPPQTANDWTAYRDTTVAEDNPNYPEDAPVAVVVYRDELAEFDSNWDDHDTPFLLSDLNEAGVSYYSFPVPRLKSLEQPDTKDPDNTESEITENAEDTIGTEKTDDASSDESEIVGINDESSEDEESREANASDDESDPELPAAVRDLKDNLTDRGMIVEINDDQTITAEKLGERYRLQPGEVIDGDGRYREKLEEIVAET